MKIQKIVLYSLDAVAMITEAQAKKFDAVIMTSDIASHLGISKEFVRNLLSQLVKAEVLVSNRGSSGGYRLAREPHSITIREIIEAVSPKDIIHLNENEIFALSTLGSEICMEIQHQTNLILDKTIDKFINPRKAGIKGIRPQLIQPTKE